MFFAIWLTTAALAEADAPSQLLTITAATPKVAIAPQAAGRQFLPLPDLEYHFLLEARCEQGWAPQSMTLSIADSRRVLQANLLDEHGFTETRLAIPAAQLAPLPVSDFCVAGETPAQGTPELKFPAALSLHAALICSNVDAEKISYVSRPLGLTLHCAQPAAIDE